MNTKDLERQVTFLSECILRWVWSVPDSKPCGGGQDGFNYFVFLLLKSRPPVRNSQRNQQIYRCYLLIAPCPKISVLEAFHVRQKVLSVNSAQLGPENTLFFLLNTQCKSPEVGLMLFPLIVLLGQGCIEMDFFATGVYLGVGLVTQPKSVCTS